VKESLDEYRQQKIPRRFCKQRGTRYNDPNMFSVAASALQQGQKPVATEKSLLLNQKIHNTSFTQSLSPPTTRKSCPMVLIIAYDLSIVKNYFDRIILTELF
jgi:hypothetical protein